MFFKILSIALLAGAEAANLSPLEGNSAALTKRTSDFSCPSPMTYCPWVKACSCPPGQRWDQDDADCVGDEVTGAWPEPSVDAYVSVDVDVELATFCAASPTKICKYDESHEYCQAGVGTVTFCASADIIDEIAGIAGEIDIEGDISATLKGVCAGLSGLFVANVDDAIALFNTDQFGLNLVVGSLFGWLTGGGGFDLGIGGVVGDLGCLLGFGQCNHDCVSYCKEGCGNWLDVGGEIGGLLDGLSGLCIVDGLVKVVGAAGGLVSLTVDSLLCIVGGLIQSVLSMFDCHCDE